MKHLEGQLSRYHPLTLYGILSFILGALLVIITPAVFREVKYDPKSVLHTVLTEAINNRKIDTTKDKPADTLLQEVAYRRYLLYNLPDSACERMLFAGQLFVGNKSMSADLIDFDRIIRNGKGPSLWQYYITYSLKYNKPLTKPKCLSSHVTLESTVFRGRIDFEKKYPCFLLWLLLVVIQFPLFTVLGMIAYGDLLHIQRLLFVDRSFIRRRGLAAAAMVLVFVICSFLAFFYDHPIMTGLFCTSFYIALVFGLLLLFAGFAGTMTFTGFMLITEYGNSICSSPVKSAPDKPVTNNISKNYVVLNGLFNRMIISVSVALSVIVLATGVLFTSINSMDFIVKMTTDFGHSPVGYHFVFLIGVLCSGLIILFFLPAKIQLVQLLQTCKSLDPDDERLKATTDALVMLKTFLTISMPALIPVVQFIIHLFIGGK